MLTAINEINKKLDNIAKIAPADNKSVQAPTATKVPPIDTTYARILKDTADNSKRIRHINAKGDDVKTRTDNFVKFRATPEMAQTKYAALRVKGTTSITITLTTEEDAVALDTLINTKFNDLVESKKVIFRRPMIKFLRIPTQNTDKLQVKGEILQYNDWLAADKFEVDQVLAITIGDSSYVNCIITCDVETQEHIILRGNISFDESVCRAYEQIEILQCNKCSRFGHISLNCINKITCKKCSGDHNHNECTAAELKCVNCETANKSFGKTINTAHNAAFDRCPMRLERVEAIKRLVTSKNE